LCFIDRVSAECTGLDPRSRYSRLRPPLSRAETNREASSLLDHSRARVDKVNDYAGQYESGKNSERATCVRAFCPGICSAISPRESDGPTIQGTNVSPRAAHLDRKKGSLCPPRLAPYVTGAPAHARDVTSGTRRLA